MAYEFNLGLVRLGTVRWGKVRLGKEWFYEFNAGRRGVLMLGEVRFGEVG